MTLSVPGSVLEERRKLLQQVLARELTDAGVGDVQVIAGGLESVVFQAASREWGAVVIKLPLARVLRTGNETHLDTRHLLVQELKIADLVGESGIPCPVAHLLYTNDDSVDFLVSEHVESDTSDAGLGALGRLVAQIHDLEPPDGLVAMDGHSSADEVVGARLCDRLARLRVRVDVPLPPANIGEAFAAAGPVRARPVLLHMDARPANLLVHRGEVRGIVDWSNALAGPAELELARIAESGNLTAEFLAGYGSGDPFGKINAAREVLYRLDTAVMLAHVWLDGDKPRDAQQRRLGRVALLLSALATGARPDDGHVLDPSVDP